MDQNLESLIEIGEACIRCEVLKPTDVLWATSIHKITVQSLLDLKRYRAAEELGTIDKQTTNMQSIKCCCFLSDIPHHKSMAGGKTTDVSLSLKVNKECPVHGHYFL